MKKLHVQLLMALSLAVTGVAKAQDTYSEEEASWRYTELDFQMIDDTLEAGYCGSQLNRYLGCLAALEQVAKLNNPQNEVAVDGAGVHFVLNPQYKEAETPKDVKQKYLTLRARFAAFEKTFSQKNADLIPAAYAQQKALTHDVQPFQIARILNASENTMYDRHTEYRPKDRYNASRFSGKDFIVGLGYDRNADKNLQILRIAPDFPAEKAGVKLGDEIFAMNGRDVKNLSDDQVAEIMTKKAGETVELNLRRHNQNFVVKLTFVPAEARTFTAREILFENKKYSYLQFSNFLNEELCEGVRAELETAQASSSAGLVLDLRDNSGGLTQQAACILGSFIGPDHVLIYEKYIWADELQHVNTTGTQVFKKPVVVLVNASTISAAEVLSGSLQAYGRALVVGTQTFGKGTEQSRTDLARIFRLETTAVYHLANGESPQLVGITPDIQTFVGPQATVVETDVMREADIGIRPLQVTPIDVPALQVRRLVAPQACMAKKNPLQHYQSTKLTDWKKDLQLLSGLAALSCAP